MSYGTFEAWALDRLDPMQTSAALRALCLAAWESGFADDLQRFVHTVRESREVDTRPQMVVSAMCDAFESGRESRAQGAGR